MKQRRGGLPDVQGKSERICVMTIRGYIYWQRGEGGHLISRGNPNESVGSEA